LDRGSNKAEREAAFQKLQSERVAKNLEEDRERDAEERQERKQIRQDEREEREQVRQEEREVRQAGARESARSGGELHMSKTGRGSLLQNPDYAARWWRRAAQS
jgi:hypothetical protein